jgi:hypothetical protein
MILSKLFQTGMTKRKRPVTLKDGKTEQSVSSDEIADIESMLERMVSEEVNASGLDPEALQETLAVGDRHVQAIKRMGAAIMPGLCYAVSHPDPGIRRKSCWALQILGSDSGLPDTVISVIAKLVTDMDGSVCEQALHSLGVLASSAKLSAAVPGLVDALKSKDSKVRKITAEVLGKIGSEAAGAIDSLRPMFSDPDMNVSQAAKAAFINLGGKAEETVAGSSAEAEQLAQLTASSQDSVKKKAWADLAKLTNREDVVERLMKTFRESGGKALGIQLPKFLGEVGTEACRAPLLEILQYARRSCDEWEQKYLANMACLGLLHLQGGVSALRRTAAPELLSFVIMHGLMAADDRERSVIVETLTKDERRSIIDGALALFRSAKKKGARAWEVSTVLKALGADALEALLEVFRSAKPSNIRPDGSVLDDDGGEDGAPASALVQIPGGIEKLKVLCSADEYERILIRAHNYGDYTNPAVNGALGEIATPKAIGRLLFMLWQNRHGAEVRKPANDALVKIGKKAHEQLLKAFEIKVPTNREFQTSLRKEVLAVLYETGDEECISAIEAVLASDPLVSKEAQTAIEAIHKRRGGITVPEVIVPRSLPITLIARVGDPYVDDCFHIDFNELYEDRDWFHMPEAKNIPDLGNAGRVDEALLLTADLQQKYPDFYFSYHWLSVLYRQQKRYDDARNSLKEGLRFAKSKESLCTEMGELEWELHNLPEAVKWWIKSIAVQVGSQYATDYVAFLNLSYVAEALRMRVVCSKLRSWVDRMRSGQLRLNAQAANALYSAVDSNEASAMRYAIELLDRHYLSKREE